MKKTYYKLTYYCDIEFLRDESKNGVPMIFEYNNKDINSIINHIDTDLENSEPDEGFYKLKIIEMNKDKFENLPEFDGY